ncbi:hypothetical protein L1987_54310 [Smallanthus sonchifolius]|uniref:Uncharacterized protein n=2 Tax=Smallanthus sonchifolius TaxID=185202 RepID=A0ACB9E695_9ASTR|nr:hypothetical protein L1987_54308 [Smallanthus sonchifolius]KAI3754525.1 hypothetical protein L1987_54310 [Smallanthus sonchifolius]
MKTDKVLALFRGIGSSTSFCSLYMDSHPTAVELETPFDRTRFPYVLGSCRGLICLSSGPDDRLVLLWNPSTRNCKLIPTPIHYNPPAYGDIITIDQVGYDHVNDDYKVVRLAQCSGPRVNFEVSVYSLKLNMWQSEEQIFPYKFFPVPCSGQGVCVSGAVHWLVNQKPGPVMDCLIVALDLASQRFESVPQPEYSDNYVALDLGILGGCLCVVGNGEMRDVDVWVMG